MTEPGEGSGEPSGTADTPRPNDGSLDFSTYTLTQLNDLRHAIDPVAYPLNHANLLAEIARRQAPADDPSTPGASGRFSMFDGWRGWLDAKRRLSPVFGTGSLEVGPGDLTLHGLQRTWLGASVPAAITVPIERVRNVAQDREWVRFEIKRPWWPARQVHFRVSTPEEAAAFAALLPDTKTPAFERRWSEIRDFQARLDSVSGRGGVVPALVLANIAVFVAMVVFNGGLRQFETNQVFTWGANFGPLTIGGQWWRLITALFLHAGVFHLLANMWVLASVGALTRRIYGNGPFLVIYFGSGIFAGLASIAWDPALASVGASGAIFGVLGAFLAFMLRQRADLPPAVVRAHWMSTLVFVLFNLVSGAMQPNIDNAAHVGGLLAGLALGWCLARPLRPEARERFPVSETAASAGLMLLLLAAALAQVRVIGSQLTTTEQFALQNSWYIEGEQKNLEYWQQLAGLAQAGAISDAQLTRTFRKDILPFWEDAHTRLEKQLPETSLELHELTAILVEFARLRRDWARVLGTEGSDNQARTTDAMRLMEETGRVQAQLNRLTIRAAMDRRPRALAHSLFVNRLRSLFTPGSWECVGHPPRAGRERADDDSATDGPAMSHGLGCRAQRLLHDGDYEALDAMMHEAAKDLNDLPDGSSSLSAIYRSLAAVAARGDNIEELFGKTADWRRAVGDPIMAELVEAMFFEEWAWLARGGGTYDEVTGQGWFLFKHRSEMAAAALRAIEKQGGDNPLWYDLSLDVALDLSRETAEIRALFDRGAARFPTYYPLHASMIRTLQPRWQGSHEDVDRFINEVAGMPRDRRDDAIYAQLYWRYFVMELDSTNIFVQGEAEWPSVDLGIQALRTRYPESDYWVNVHAAMACVAQDAERYSELRPQVARRHSQLAWSAEYSLEECDRRMNPRRQTPLF